MIKLSAALLTAVIAASTAYAPGEAALSNALDLTAIVLTVGWMLKLLLSGEEIKFDLNRLIASGIEKQCLLNQRAAAAAAPRLANPRGLANPRAAALTALALRSKDLGSLQSRVGAGEELLAA